MEKKGIGLVFAGGGGRGSYEIGVWKYLHEITLDKQVSIVSGTSVGALNATLFAGCDYETAEKIWLNISQDKILTPKQIPAEDIMEWFVGKGLNICDPITKGFSTVVSGALFGAETITLDMINKYIGGGCFSREGLKEIIEKNLDFEKLRNSHILCYATCLRVPFFDVERFILNDYSKEEITSILLASSAIPIIFPLEEIFGDKYCDGGFPIGGDNVPITPVYEEGLKDIIVVHLKQDTIIDKEKYTDARIIEVVPQDDLGDILGTLDFSPEGALQRLNKGYEDAKRILSPMFEMVKLTKKNLDMLNAAVIRNDELEKKRAELKEIEQKNKDELNALENDPSFAKLLD